MSYPLEPDPYEALGVDKDADIATIRKAYRKLVFLCHPDRIRDENRQGASQEFEEVQTAYEILADETSRQRYDERVKLAKIRQEMRQESKVVRSRRDGYDGTDLYPYGRRASTWERKESRAEGDNEPSSYNDQVRKETRRYVGMFSSDKEYLEEYVSCATTYHYNWNPVSTSLESERRYRLERREREKERRDRLKRQIETRRARRSARNERRPQAIRAYSSQRKAIMSLEQHEKHRRQHEIFEQQRLRFLGIPPPIPKRLAKKPAAGILALEGFVNGNFVCTNPDTGAQANLIALAFAESIGLHLFDREPESQVGFRMANGNMIYSIGRAIARWSFKKGSSESYEISFYVFAECCFDVVIGDPFLRATRTMSTNEHRLSWIPRPKWALYVRRINLLGCPSQQMRGKLSGEEVFALADTGAEGGNLVSYDYAKRRGWLTSDLVGKRSLLQFPDGSQSRTEGQVRKVWRYHGTLVSALFPQCHGSTPSFSTSSASVKSFRSPPKRPTEVLLTSNCEQVPLGTRKRSLSYLMSCTTYHSTSFLGRTFFSPQTHSTSISVASTISQLTTTAWELVWSYGKERKMIEPARVSLPFHMND